MEEAFQYLMKLKNDNLKYTKIKMQEYLKCESTYRSNGKNLYKYRTRMAHVKKNFPSQYKENLKCPECEINLQLQYEDIIDDSQEHLLNHIDVAQVPSFMKLTKKEIYLKLFNGNNAEKIDVVNLLEEALMRRNHFF